MTTREPPAAQLLAQIASGADDAPPLWQIWVSHRLDEVRPDEWDALLEPDDAPLLSWAYLQGLEEAGCVGGKTSWQPAHLLIRKLATPGTATGSFGEGQLVAAAPAYLKYDSDGEWVFDFDWASFAASSGIAYYPKLVLAVPFNPVGGSRLLTHPSLPETERDLLRSLLLQTAKNICTVANLSSVHILFPRPHQPALEAIVGAGFLPRQQEQYHFRNQGYRSFDDFLGRMRGSRRTAIRRERRALREAGVTVRTHAGLKCAERPDGFTLDELDAMFDLYLSTSLRYTGAPPYLNRRFFHLCAERLGARLELVLARDREGALVGGAWNLRGDRRLFGRYWGQREAEVPEAARNAELERNPETGRPLEKPPIPFLHFEVCYYHSIERCIAEGLDVFEPGHGGEHKLARGFTPVLTHSAHHLRDVRLRLPIGRFLSYESPQVLASLEAALERCPLTPRSARKINVSGNPENLPENLDDQEHLQDASQEDTDGHSEESQDPEDGD